MQIRPEVYLIKGRASNLYLCVDDQGLALVDTGMPGDQKLVLAEIERLGYRPEQLTRIVITHADIDHAGSLAALQEATGAKVFAGALTSQFLKSGRSPDHLPGPLQWFSRRFVKYRPVNTAGLQTVAAGDDIPVLGGLQALATPGHTPDHFSFYCPSSGVLFTGDALKVSGTRLQRSPKRITADQEAANASAIRLLELTPAVFACGHGQPMVDHKSDDLMILFNNLREVSP